MQLYEAVATHVAEWGEAGYQHDELPAMYGGFFTQEPAKAIVSFRSPTILECLRQQHKDYPLFQPQSSDWRSMGDANYNGSVFDLALTEVPERRNNLVEARKGDMTAVKVTDMPGEESTYPECQPGRTDGFVISQ